MGKKVECCGDCRYSCSTYKAGCSGDNFLCRRLPPVFLCGQGELDYAKFPDVEKTNWCGEFAMTDEAIEKHLEEKLLE